MEKLTVCKNCGKKFEGKYCNVCGEKIFNPNDKSLKHIFHEAFHFLTHFEGTFFTTLKTFANRPGKVSVDYCNGTRKKYFKPISFFLVLVILYLLFPFFEGLNMKLQSYLENNFYGSYATRKVNALLNAGVSKKDLYEIFSRKSEKVSKFLLLVIIPFTALFFWLLTFSRRKYFYDQMVFAAEINCIFLLWSYILLPLLFIVSSIIYYLFAGKGFELPETVVGILMYVVLGLYVIIAAKRFYEIKIWKAILLTLMFLVAHSFIVQTIYKFILFYFVINQIKA